MEQIYTIPVNEAFEAALDHPECGCPLCTLFRKLENNELDLILGASMMEPDVRIQTNKEGFCKTHYDLMFTRKNRLGMALTMESHLQLLQKELKDDGLGGGYGRKPVKRIAELEASCYVCRRIEYHFSRMLLTALELWNTDEAFRAKVKKQPYFCLPHYRRLTALAQEKMSKKQLHDFASALSSVQDAYLAALNEDISWFCKKFDYRYDAEPWYNSRDAVERAIKFLSSDIHRNEK